MSARAAKVNVCHECWEDFTPTHVLQLFCSKICRSAANKAHRRTGVSLEEGTRKRRGQGAPRLDIEALVDFVREHRPLTWAYLTGQDLAPVADEQKVTSGRGI